MSNLCLFSVSPNQVLITSAATIFLVVKTHDQEVRNALMVALINTNNTEPQSLQDVKTNGEYFCLTGSDTSTINSFAAMGASRHTLQPAYFVGR